jgi:hypothetical protein
MAGFSRPPRRALRAMVDPLGPGPLMTGPTSRLRRSPSKFQSSIGYPRGGLADPDELACSPVERSDLGANGVAGKTSHFAALNPGNIPRGGLADPG